MSHIVLSSKAAKLMKVCEAEGFDNLDDLLALSVVDSVCPAICMTEGCDYTAETRHGGRRFAVYVPEDLVGEVRRAVDNGRALQDLLMQAAARYVEALKRVRRNTAKRKKS